MSRYNQKPKRHRAGKFCQDLVNRYTKSLEYADIFYKDRTIITGKCPDWRALPTSFVASVITGTNDKKAIMQAQGYGTETQNGRLLGKSERESGRRCKKR
jgi:hypothetical protein